MLTLALRKALQDHGWYVATVVGSDWVESSEWAPVLIAASPSSGPDLPAPEGYVEFKRGELARATEPRLPAFESVVGALRAAAEQAHGFMHYGPFTDCEAEICARRYVLSGAAAASSGPDLREALWDEQVDSFMGWLYGRLASPEQDYDAIQQRVNLFRLSASSSGPLKTDTPREALTASAAQTDTPADERMG